MLDRSLSRSTREGEHRGRIARSLRTGAVGRPSSSSVSMGARLAEAEDARRLGSMRHRRQRRGGRAGHLGSERPCGRWRGLEVGGLDPDLFAAHEAHSPPGSIVVKGREDAVLPVEVGAAVEAMHACHIAVGECWAGLGARLAEAEDARRRGGTRHRCHRRLRRSRLTRRLGSSVGMDSRLAEAEDAR
eukprot:scaffold34382_cov69-Phaeocystis_antarctica.AAC.3